MPHALFPRLKSSLQFLVAGSSLLLLVAGPAQATSKAERLAKGEVIVRTSKVTGYDMPKAHVEAIIKAPPATVWKIIEKCGNYEKTMPRIAKAREVSRKGNVVLCDVTVDLPFPLSDLQAVTRAKHTEKAGTYKRAWKLVKGDYEVNTGSWTIIPHGENQTLVKYEVFAVPNVSLPTFIQETAQQNSLPNLIQKLRKQTES